MSESIFKEAEVDPRDYTVFRSSSESIKEHQICTCWETYLVGSKVSVFIINIPRTSRKKVVLLTWSQAGSDSLIALNEQCRRELGRVELSEITTALSDFIKSLAECNTEHVHLRTWPVWECGPTPPGDSCRATAPLAGSPSQTVPGTLWICRKEIRRAAQPMYEWNHIQVGWECLLCSHTLTAPKHLDIKARLEERFSCLMLRLH